MFSETFKVVVLGILCVAGIPSAGIAIKEKFFSSKITIPEDLSEISTKLQPKPRNSSGSASSTTQVKNS